MLLTEKKMVLITFQPSLLEHPAAAHNRLATFWAELVIAECNGSPAVQAHALVQAAQKEMCLDDALRRSKHIVWGGRGGGGGGGANNG